MSKIRIGIVGYGNLGRGVEASVKLQPDMELVGVFSRRKGLETVSGVPTYTMEDLPNFKGKIDVMVLCGGSATDLIEQTPMVTKYFNCIDSFDTHARIPEHFANVDKVAKEAKTATLISCGWDPGMFSLQRVYAESILPQGKSYTLYYIKDLNMRLFYNLKKHYFYKTEINGKKIKACSKLIYNFLSIFFAF